MTGEPTHGVGPWPGAWPAGEHFDPELLAQILAVPVLPAPADALHLDLTERTPKEAVTELLAALGGG